MSRVQCLECGIAVVVDPTGVCPEGHLIGGTGVRVAGAMGTDTRHPDEPEPWVATVVLDEADAAPVVRERTIRPLRLTGADETTDSANDEAADHESMLRELHALGDIHDTAPAPSPSRSPRPDRDLSPDPAAAATAVDATGAPPVPHSPPPPQEQVAEGFAELSALEAAFHALAYDQDAPRQGEQPTDPPPTSASPPPSDPTDAAPRDDLADLEDLFATQGAHRSEPTVARDPGAPDQDQDQDQDQAHGPGRTETPAPPPNASPVAPPVGSAPTPAAAPAHPPAASTPAAAHATPDVPPPSTATVEEPTPEHADETPRANQAGLDITNFTAHGGKVGAGRGGRRKRFGR